MKRILFDYLASLNRFGIEDLPEPTESQLEMLSELSAQVVAFNEQAARDSADRDVKNEVRGVELTNLRDDKTPSSDQSNPSADQSNPLDRSSEVSSLDRAKQLSVIESEVSGCTKCEELACNRTQTVFGTGDPNARICFVGEAPGADEDRLGEPFVGKAGQLLTRIIEACQLKRSDVYILNTVKCRPPANRNPEEAELDNCWPYALRQLEIIRPEYIVCLGSVATQTVLQKKESVGRLRQSFHSFGESKVVVTYHPAYLLRTPAAKRQVWEDMKMMMNDMGVDL